MINATHPAFPHRTFGVTTSQDLANHMLKFHEEFVEQGWNTMVYGQIILSYFPDAKAPQLEEAIQLYNHKLSTK